MEANAPQIPVYLLKTASTPTDNYATTLADSSSTTPYNFKPHFIPVLEHKFVEESLTKLQKLISQGSFTDSNFDTTSPSNQSSSPRTTKIENEEKYNGIIFTSQRAVDAFSQAVSTLRSIPQDPSTSNSTSISTDANINISTLLPQTLPLYAVGPATARGLRALSLQCRILGEESGNGDALAQFILDDLSSQRSNTATSTEDPRLLFLVGETRRDIIPRTLSANNVTVDELTVYATTESPSFAENFRVALDSQISGDELSKTTKTTRSSGISWVLVFSPQGCKAVLSTLGILDPTTQRVFPEKQKIVDRLLAETTSSNTNTNTVGNTNTTDSSTSSDINPTSEKSNIVLVASIGPTTQAHLWDTYSFEVDVCAAQPTPKAVTDGIIEFMQRNRLFP